MAKKGDKAFAAVAKGKAFNLDMPFYPFPLKPEAFRIAAEMVIQQCHEADRFRYRDELFFPVAFLYRHGIELFLKDIITTGCRLNCIQKSKDVSKLLTQHHLARL